MKQEYIKVLTTDPARRFDFGSLQDPTVKKGREARRALERMNRKRRKKEIAGQRANTDQQGP